MLPSDEKRIKTLFSFPGNRTLIITLTNIASFIWDIIAQTVYQSVNKPFDDFINPFEGIAHPFANFIHLFERFAYPFEKN